MLYVSVLLLLLRSSLLGADLVRYNFDNPPYQIITDDSNRVRGFRDDSTEKDFIIGGLFAVHSPAAGSAGGRCSSDLVRSGAERTEAFLYALDLVNSDPDLLPNIDLGYDIRDTCVSENIALDEAVELLFQSGTNSSTACITETASQGNSTSTRSTIAVIGPTTSQVALPVASLLRLFTMPGVSYSVSSPTFNNRDRYGYFYRAHPPDSQEAQAIIDFVNEFGWTYVTIIHSNNAYGEPAINILRQLAEDRGICIDLDIGLDDDFNDDDYYRVATRLMNESYANVIIAFASLSYMEQLLEQFSLIDMSGTSRNFVWIGTTAWAQSSSIGNNYPNVITGLFGFGPFTNKQSSFNDYFSQLTLNSNNRNPWFREYYEDYFECVQGSSCVNTTPVTNHTDYVQRDYIQLVIDSVYSIAHALNNFLNDSCDQPLTWNSATQTCTGQSKQLTGEELRNYLQNVNFTSPSGNRIIFDAFGNIEGHYSIVNFQKINDNEFEYVSAGLWGADSAGNFKLRLEEISFQFGIDSASGEPLSAIESQCQQCPMGQIKVLVQSACCGTCAPCRGDNFTNSSTATECESCPNGRWGNDPLAGSHFCKDIEETYLDATDGFGILLVIVALFGLICVLLVSVALGIYWTTPVIKSSGREQMILLLTGIAMSFLVTIFFLLRPSIAICLLQRVGTWFCFSLVLSALFIKLVRIARIFLNVKSTKRPKFIESKYQIAFTFLLVAIQMVLVVVSLVVVYPEATENLELNSENTLGTPTLEIQCSSPHIGVLAVQILFYSLLLIATNILAIMTIRFPENFNEARYVAFATFSTFLIWVGFLQTYFAVDDSYRVAVLCFAIQLSSLAVLFCLFVPRIFIVIIRPILKDSETHLDTVPPSTVSGIGMYRLSAIPSEEHKDTLKKVTIENNGNGNGVHLEHLKL